MPLFKKKSIETHKSSPSSSEDSTPSLLDFSGSDSSSPIISKDYALPTLGKPTFAIPGSSGRATVLLSSDNGGDASLGSSPSNPLHPSIITNEVGQPVTALNDPSSITEILSSGEKGLGTEGVKAIDSLHSVSKLGRGVENDLVVGEAQGVNPEFSARSSKTPSITDAVKEEGAEKESSGKPSWFKRLAGKGHESENSVEGDESNGSTTSGLGALSAILPQSITGVDISSIGLSNTNATSSEASSSTTSTPPQIDTQGSTTDKDGKSLPTQLTSTIHHTVTSSESLTGSIKDKIQEDHDLVPRKTNSEFHQYFEEIPQDDELIEDYRCALQREILVQGRLFVSENNLAFRANIFGWSTNLIVPWSEVVSIEKKMTGKILLTLHRYRHHTDFKIQRWLFQTLFPFRLYTLLILSLPSSHEIQLMKFSQLFIDIIILK